MTQQKIPDRDQLSDAELVKIPLADGTNSFFQYDTETNTLYTQASNIIIPSHHALTHISSDPIPTATTDLNGLLSNDDKAKLDALTQMRIGILGFSGSGFPDSGGMMSGDIILATGSELLSIERIGNVVRFTVDQSMQFCACEECAQIFWIQDESDVAAIRPPSCNGKLPGVNAYGELKIFLLPESTILNPANPLPTLNQKGSYPALVFKRFDDAITPGLGEFEAVLSRNPNGTTNVGWAMTPGAMGTAEAVWFMGADDDGNQIRFDLQPNADSNLLGALLYKGHTITRQMGVVTGYTETVLSTNVYKIKFWDVLGGQPSGDEFTATNVWRYNNPENSPTALVNPRLLVVDGTKDILPVGTLVSMWEFQISAFNDTRITRRFFNKDPGLTAEVLWGLTGSVRFGDLLQARLEVNPGTTGERQSSENNVSDVRTFEKDQWGITGFEDPLLLPNDGEGTDPLESVLATNKVVIIDGEIVTLPAPNRTILVSSETTNPTEFFVDNEFVGKILEFTTGSLAGQKFEILRNTETTITVFGELIGALAGDNFVIFGETSTGEPSGVPINNQFVAIVDPTIPGLKVVQTDPQSDSERPIYLWHRQNHGSILIKALIGMPDSSIFPPIDILLRAPGDSYDDRYVKIIKRGQFSTGPYAGKYWIQVKGVDWMDLPQSGVLRSLTGLTRNEIWKYSTKIAWSASDDDAIMLVSSDGVQYLFDEDFGIGSVGSLGSEISTTVDIPSKLSVASLLHQDFTASAVRLEFSVNDAEDAESVQLQVRAGTLSMTEPYELDVTAQRNDDLVRGFLPGKFSVSKIMTQQGFITSIETPVTDPEDFRVYKGGFLPAPIDGLTERFNELEIMYRQNQMWIWWNKLLVTPDPILTSKLPTPVVVNTPYFPVESAATIGKVIFRLWPGTVIRQIEVRDQLKQFNEFSYGQLTLS
jgi:hypothetical protein